MTYRSIKLLLLEDNPDHVDLFCSILELTSFHKAVVENYDSLAQGLEQLNKQPYDLVFVDLSLKDSIVTSTLGQLNKIKATCPVIVITSLDDKETLLDIINKGADDCLPKSELNDFTLERIIHYNLDRAELSKKLVTSEAAYKDLYHNSPIYNATFDPKTRRIISCNETLATSLGWKSDDLIGMDLLNIYHPDSLEEAESIHHQLSEQQITTVENSHLLLVNKSGIARDVLLNISTVKGSGTQDDRCHATWVDTTERVKAREEVQHLQQVQKQILDSIKDPVWLKDLESNFVACNKSFTQFTGLDEQSIIGKSSYDFFPQALCDVVIPLETKTIRTGETTSTETWMTSPVSNKQVLFEITKTPLRNAEGVITGVVGYGYDLTERHKLAQQLEYYAEHDHLTQLPNRQLFSELFLKAKQQSDRDNTVIALLFIDLDGFKQINDTYGHDIGDQVLVSVSGRITEAIREADIVGRHGGDEFIAAITNLSSTGDALPLVERILTAFNEGITVSKDNASITIEISSSIGVTYYEKSEKSLKELLHEADDAMYRAKAEGKNCYRVFLNSPK